MATKARVIKSERSIANPKYKTRTINRCFICGRRHGYMRDFGICRICFRELARKNKLPGIKKSSW
ncbi:type Z 30S ribosomal protein S14 [bacterium]|nr:type Z 30S ribosomal protein S14 [bacterium]